MLRNNLYFNGGRPIPMDRNRVLNVTDDPQAIVKDPGLPVESPSAGSALVESRRPSVR